ncbi:Peroxidasin-like protein [Hypsibius exemplaris]|uniref:Peroxidasin-like protein n=1 Tax=Hypsibius exemplaris TaxID=2072580 RepID=A0A1W0WME2_HYPEX|nr:Peroxidasin-like protein [Hypsibius exemplaris]
MNSVLLLTLFLALFSSNVQGQRRRRQNFGRNFFGRSDASGNSGFSSAFPNFFNQNFASSSPFGTFSFQPSFAPIPSPFNSAPSSPTNFQSFSDIAHGFGSNRQIASSPMVDNFFAGSSPSWTNIQPQQRPAPLQMQQPMTFPAQNWATNSGTAAVQSSSDLQTQINSIFRQNGMWSLPQNFVQDKFNEAWQKSTQQFGSAAVSSGAPMGGGLATGGFTTLQFGTPGSQSDMFAGTSANALDLAKSAFTLEDFSKSLSTQLNLNKTTAASALPLVTIAPSVQAPQPTIPTPVQAPQDLTDVDAAQAQQESTPPPTPAPAVVAAAPTTDCIPEQPVVPIRDFLNPARQPACAQDKYRSHTGQCNNICFPKRGKDNTVFIRLLGADYADGISEPRKSSRGKALPSARLVSSALISTKIQMAPTWTNMFMQFGQFLDHDITQTPRAQLSDDAPQCCGAANPHPQCFSISIPSNDPFYSKFQQDCMEFVRSLPGIRPGCRLGPREQMNQQTAFIDASQIYGVRPKEVKNLREFSQGRLKSRIPFANNPTYTLLPSKDNTCVDGSTDKPCFNAGDNRCNVQLGLQTLHTVFMRHHNNIVARLLRMNPDWDDEKLYQEARAIVAAQLQHITYNEWLPLLLGQDQVSKMGLRVLTSGRFTGYNVSIHPGLINEFSTAAMRVGHSMVPGKFDRYSADFVKTGSVRLRDTFFKSAFLYQNGAVDELIRGLTQQQGKAIDNSITADLSQQLFVSAPDLFGMDLVALNVQRGRDHGITGWMKWRKLCGLPTADNFGDLKAMGILPDETANRLASVYDSVEDIDLYPAGIAELQVNDGFVGPTFGCILSEQFWRLRVGDRFYYENNLPLPSTFSDAQLAQIRKSSLSRILCDTVSGLQSVQASVFETVSNENPRIPCDQIAPVSLKPWTDV